jgi:hypothetical protein
VPYPVTWALEDADPGAAVGRYEVLDDLRGLPAAPARLDGELTLHRSLVLSLQERWLSGQRTGAAHAGQQWVKQRAERVPADQGPQIPR